MTGTRQRRRNQKKSSPALIALKVLYWIVFALSLVIVGGYLVFCMVVRPPERPAQPTAPAVTVQPTDDPATSTDESQASPTVLPAGDDQPTRKEECYTFLLVGMDDGNGNTDTMMVVTYDVKNQHVGVVSVPRDTLVDVPRTIKKINAAYASGGIDELKREVSDLLGFPVDHHIIVNLKGFRVLVDKLGGVDFNVPVNMNYDDPVQNLHIHLNKGMQHLDGAKALQLVRFRSGYANADIGRIETQQKFLTALAKKLLSWDSVTKVNEFVDIFAQYVKTDLSVGNLAYFGIAALDMDLETGISMGTLPGDGLVTYRGIPYYYELYPQETLELLNSCGMSPYEEPLTLEQMNIFQVP